MCSTIEMRPSLVLFFCSPCTVHWLDSPLCNVLLQMWRDTCRRQSAFQNTVHLCLPWLRASWMSAVATVTQAHIKRLANTALEFSDARLRGLPIQRFSLVFLQSTLLRVVPPRHSRMGGNSLFSGSIWWQKEKKCKPHRHTQAQTCN